LRAAKRRGIPPRPRAACWMVWGTLRHPQTRA
jgi:hypothetical protein